MKKKVTDRLWVAMDGSIYTVDTDNVKIDFTGKTMRVQTAIAFNVGQAVAFHIVDLHNANIGMKQFAEFLDGSPERFKVK